MTSRIVCMTGCNDGFGQLADICLRSLRYYCQRHDLSLAFHPLAHARRPVSWAKIPLIQQALRSGADFVFWVDADALIVDPSRSIREVIEPGNDFYLARLDDGHRTYLNGGVMLLRNSPWMSDFLQRVWDLKEYIDHQWWETAAITHLLSPESFSDVGIPDGRTLISGSGDTTVRIWGTRPLRDVREAQRERQRIVRAVQPIVDDLLDRLADPGQAAAALRRDGSLTDDEREVALQLVLMRTVGK